MTIKDNRYVSRQLDQQYKEKKLQYRKELKYKAIVKKEKKKSLQLVLWKHPLIHSSLT